jgi:ankyrin repeat protein
MNKFDKPYRIAPSFDSRKNIEMFDLASRLDTHEMLQHSLINQISFDIADEEANTLIHIVINVDSRKASQHSKLGVIKFLVNNGANPDKPNKYNQTPLHLACHYQYDLIVEYLLTIDVNANFKDNMGLTPFHYLLTGDIKTIENTGEIMNFVPPPKKQDVKKNETLIEIKKDIYNLLIKQLITDKFPIIKTFENTIKNILDNDSDFINYRIGLEEKIVKLALDTTPPNYLQEIKNTVDISLKAITKKIEKLFNNLPELNEFQIHSTERNSWSHPSNTQPLSLIKNGNTKKSIKAEVNKASDNILQLQNDFSPYNSNITSYQEDGLNEIMGLYFSSIKNKFRKNKGATTLEYKGNFDSSDFEIIDDINEQIKHVNAFDNASSIMDFPNLKYAGGPRDLILGLPMNSTKPPTQIPPIQIVKDLSQMSINKQIFYMLSSPLTTTSIDAIVNGPIDLFKIDATMYNTYFQNDLTNISNWTQMSGTLIGTLNPDIEFAVLCYIIFAKTAISNPERFEELSNVSYLHTIAGPNTAFFQDNPVVIKWFNMFMDGINVASFIYGMWCDLTCYFSPSNLDGIVPLNLAILVSALANNTLNLDQSIYNSYKPHLVYDICNGVLSSEEKIASVTMLLLNENCTNLYFNNIDKDYTTLILLSTVTKDIDKNVLLIGKLVLTYFQNPSTFNPSVSTEEGKLYLIYNKSGKKPINILVNIILEFYGKMINKPLKQTIIDFIYLLISYDQSTTKTINDFKKMSIYEIKNPTLISNLSENLIPSHYGLENVVIDSPKFTIQKNLVFNHFQIAHVLGLYFEGMCNPHQNYFTLNDLFTINNIEFGIIPSTSLNHSFNTTTRPVKIDDDQLPLPFNNVITTALPDDIKFRYYNIDNREIVNPSIHSYFMMVVKRIQLYQKKIAELLKEIRLYIDQLVNGKTTNLGSLITKLYPTIVSYCKIINSYNDSYERINKNYATSDFWKKSELRKKFTSPDNYSYTELAKNINTINASFYLYYYVLAPDKLVKLSKFNYYQIPITTPNKYLFYVGNDENVYDAAELSSTGSSSSKILNTPETDVTLHTTPLNSGFVSQFSIGNYASFYNEYKTNNFNTVSVENSDNFVFNKENKLPPSLFNNLAQFYKFCLIELVIKTITEIDGKTGTMKTLYDKLQNYVKSTGIEMVEYDVSAYHIVSKIVQEIIREQFSLYIYNEVHEVFNRDVVKVPLLKSIPVTSISTKKEMTISLDKTDIVFNKLKSNKIINLYNLLVQPAKSDEFILYPNDLTNISRLKLKTGINVNTKIIELLLSKRGSPYHINLEGQTPIYNLIKNYNFKPVKSLKKLGIDFRDFDGEQPVQFLLKELTNNIDKIIGSIPSKPTNKNILSNFDNYLYNDVKILITSNEVYGNNILAYLPVSFNMSTYIVLQYLLESLINTDDNFTFDDLTKFLSLIEVDIKNINSNYLEEKLASFKIPIDFDVFIAKEFIKEKYILLTQYKKEKNQMDTNITKLRLSSNGLAQKMIDSSKYKKLKENIKKLNSDYKSLGKIISSSTRTRLTSVSSVPEYKIINRYKKIGATHNGLVMNAWEQLFNIEYSKENYNLGLIQLLIKQNDIIQNFNLANMDKLRELQKPLKKLSEIAESYFLTPKFTETNNVAHFVRDMIEYLTETTICTGLELVMRRILHTYFSNTLPDDSQEDINDRIEYILEKKTYGMDKSLLDILKINIAPELAKNASEIFDNQADEQGHTVRPVRDVLISFFQNLENSPIKLPGEIITIFIKDVVSYFDTFASRAILLWQVNAENILKYFINNYRCVETLLSL